jgi:hypothetical protein
VSGRFEADVLELLDREREVDVETTGLDGWRQRTTIWVVVEGDDVFVRSWRGERGRWYRAAVARPAEVALVATGRRIPVHAVQAADAESVSRCSAALERKYAGDPSTPAMVAEEVLATTLRLEPRPD